MWRKQLWKSQRDFISHDHFINTKMESVGKRSTYVIDTYIMHKKLA